MYHRKNLLKEIDTINYTNNTNFEKDVLNNTKPVMIEFGAEWCGPCHILAPVLEGLRNEFGTQMDFYKIDFDKEKPLADQYGVTNIPCLLFFKNGEVVDLIEGTQGKSLIRSKIMETLEA